MGEEKQEQGMGHRVASWTLDVLQVAGSFAVILGYGAPVAEQLLVSWFVFGVLMSTVLAAACSLAIVLVAAVDPSDEAVAGLHEALVMDRRPLWRTFLVVAPFVAALIVTAHPYMAAIDVVVTGLTRFMLALYAGVLGVHINSASRQESTGP